MGGRQHFAGAHVGGMRDREGGRARRVRDAGSGRLSMGTNTGTNLWRRKLPSRGESAAFVAPKISTDTGSTGS